MCYQCSENKGADQLRGYHEADLRLCFRIWKKPVFLRRGSHCFEGEILVLIVPVPGNCLYFSNVFDKYDLQSIDGEVTNEIYFSTSLVKKSIFEFSFYYTQPFEQRKAYFHFNI